MGSGGVPNRGVEKTYDRSLQSKGQPNSRIDRYKDGNKVQSRWYDENGKAIRNRDYAHGGDMNFPHDHDWEWNGDNGVRGIEHLKPDYENFY